jgi:transposase
MNDAKYIGLDVHQATISATVLDSAGKLVMEAILETKAVTILQFIHGMRGDLQVTFEEGTCAAWLHDLLKSHVTQVLVCDPRKNALLKVGNKSDRIDAQKLAELLRSNLLRSVYPALPLPTCTWLRAGLIHVHLHTRHRESSATPLALLSPVRAS